ncbi:MAG TPA: class I adenylate-forming enzyme family protein [Woeseiaceae bacterium]|nr:class I adenylate-forming enzyme family protein [Woeseiaceae bacterium]
MNLQPLFRQILAHADVPGTAGKTAVAWGDRSLSYGELGRAVRNRAALLGSGYGVAAGERVALLAESDGDFVATYLAVHSLGGICAPLDPRTPPDRLLRVIEKLSPCVTVSRNPLAAEVRHQARYTELAGRIGGSSAPSVDVSLDRTADILFTTGTTADPKGVVLSHRALATACAHINRFIGTTPDAVEVLPLLLNHSFGLGRMRCVLSLGATLVLVPGFANAGRVIAALAQHRATGFASVPAGIAILLSDGEALAHFADQLDYVEIGSSAMPIEQKRRLMELLPNTRLCMHYGLTEASRSVFLEFHGDGEKLDSIGRPSPGVELRIADESGESLRCGETGQIEVRGGHLMSGYWRDPELTANTLRAGWLRTGDLGRQDADGYVFLEARADDVINVGGRKVLPQEIEEILERHPAIADCACAGIPDPQGLSGEMVAVWLVPGRPDGELPAFSELAKLLRQKLEPYKTPRRFFWTDRIPRSSAGKLLRRELREL